MNISVSSLLAKETTDNEVEKVMTDFRDILASGRDVAFVIRKGALTDARRLSIKIIILCCARKSSNIL